MVMPSASGGLQIRAGHAQFFVDGDQMIARWSTPWTGRQEQRVTRADISTIAAVPDDRLMAGDVTMRLRITLADGKTIEPLRRRSPNEVQWTAARLSEWLGGKEISRTPPPDKPPHVAPRAITRPGVLAVKPLHLSLSAARRPRNGRSVFRRGVLVLRVGPANPLRTHVNAFPIIFAMAFGGLLALLGGLAFLFNVRSKFIPGYVFVALGLVFLVNIGRAVWRIIVAARTFHVLRLGPRDLRLVSKRRDSQGPPRWTGDRILRTEIIGVAIGSTSEQPPEQQLDVLLTSGGRIGWLTGRPVAELQWIAAELDANFARVPVVIPTSIRAWEASNVLSYESRRGMRGDMTVGDLPGGGVLITIPPLRAERDGRVGMLVGPTLVMLFVIGMVTIATRGRFGGVWPVVVAAAAIAALGFIIRGIMVIRRGLGEPLVLSVDGQSLSTNLPDHFRRYRRWPRERVADVRLTDRPPKGNKGSQPYVEIAFHGESSLFLCQHRGPEDRQRVIALLRAALGLPPIRPSP
jgi:hypothetical protein